MKTYTPEELRAILDAHGLWLRGEGGSRAYLSGADLSRANLSGAYLSGAYLSRANLSRANLSRANLSGADLSGAYLSGANLSGAYLSGAYLSGADLSRAYLSGADLSRANLSRANLHAWAQVAFKGHGERSRMLTAYQQTSKSPVVYQCGCFSGSAEELTKYINEDTGADGSGIEKHKASRMLAFETVTKLLSV